MGKTKNKQGEDVAVASLMQEQLEQKQNAQTEAAPAQERRQSVFSTQGGVAGDVVTEGQTKKRTLFGN